MKRTQIYIAVALLLALIGFAWFFYRRGKKQVTLQYGPAELPGNPGRRDQFGASNEELKLLANDLYADMKGLAWLGHDYDVYKRASLLGDNDLVALYNTFNTLYQRDSSNHETLTQWISSERYVDTTLPDLVISRLKKLNCL